MARPPRTTSAPVVPPKRPAPTATSPAAPPVEPQPIEPTVEAPAASEPSPAVVLPAAWKTYTQGWLTLDEARALEAANEPKREGLLDVSVGDLLGRLWSSLASAIWPLLIVLSLLLHAANHFDVHVPSPFSPASAIERRADELATKHGFSASDRAVVAGVFTKVADDVEHKQHDTATTAFTATDDGVVHCNVRNAAAWLHEMNTSWADKFTKSGPADGVAPVWREIARGLNR